jgi:hypothetical protein
MSIRKDLRRLQRSRHRLWGLSRSTQAAESATEISTVAESLADFVEIP